MLITSQAEFRRLPKPNFCYFCGDPLDNGWVVNRDHCPPKTMFRPEHLANYPTILEVHKPCHDAWSPFDERFGAIFAASSESEKALARRESLLKPESLPSVPGSRVVRDVPLKLLFYRICRFAHAVLYNQFLTEETLGVVMGPAVELNQDGTPKEINLKLLYSLSDQLLSAQANGEVSGIVSHSSNFKYVCTWDHADRGESLCIFAFDIVNSAALRPVTHSLPRCVVGYYQAPRPPGAPSVPRAIIKHTEGNRLMPIRLPDQDSKLEPGEA